MKARCRMVLLAVAFALLAPILPGYASALDTDAGNKKLAKNSLAQETVASSPGGNSIDNLLADKGEPAAGKDEGCGCVVLDGGVSPVVVLLQPDLPLN